MLDHVPGLRRIHGLLVIVTLKVALQLQQDLAQLFLVAVAGENQRKESLEQRLEAAHHDLRRGVPAVGENHRNRMMGGIFRRLHQPPLRDLDHVLYVGRQLILGLLKGIAHHRQQAKFDIRQTMRQPVTPGADPAGVERVRTFGREEDGNGLGPVHGLTNLTSAG